MYPGTVRAAVLSNAYCAQAQALFAAMTTPPVAARALLINRAIQALISCGAWTLIEVLQVYAAADAQAARLNWINPATFTATEQNSPTFTADRGYMSDGLSSYVDTGYTPSASSLFLQNSATLSVGARSGTSSNPLLGMAGAGTTVRNNITPRGSGTNFRARVNQTADVGTTVSSDDIGRWTATRDNSASINLYKNGALVEQPASASATRGGTTLWVGHSGTSFNVSQITYFYAGGLLSVDQVSSVDIALANYFAAIGA